MEKHLDDLLAYDIPSNSADGRILKFMSHIFEDIEVINRDSGKRFGLMSITNNGYNDIIRLLCMEEGDDCKITIPFYHLLDELNKNNGAWSLKRE